MTTGAEFDEGAWPFGLTPFGEIATSNAAIVDVGTLEAANTLAVFAPLMIDTAPDETDVMVGLDDRMTVGLEDSVIVPLLTAIALEIANAGAEDNVTVLATPVDSATVATEDSATVLLVNVTWIADDGMTVGLLDSVTVPDATVTDGMPTKLTLTADDGVVRFVVALEREIVPDEIASALPARMSPMLTRCR